MTLTKHGWYETPEPVRPTVDDMMLRFFLRCAIKYGLGFDAYAQTTHDVIELRERVHVAFMIHPDGWICVGLLFDGLVIHAVKDDFYMRKAHPMLPLWPFRERPN